MNPHSQGIADNNSFIMDVHTVQPGLTERSIGAARTKDGLSSYEVLCNFANPLSGMTVVDLACGNGPMCEILVSRVGGHGHVIGVDLNESELKIASKRLSFFKNCCFLQEPADRLSIRNDSIDMVFCHMAFMLFTPLKPVLSEIARILKSGAVFAAVLPTLRKPTDLFRNCISTMNSVLQAENHPIDALSHGTVKMNSPSDLKQVFSDSGQFQDDILIYDVDAYVTDTPESLARRIPPGFYNYHLLSNAARLRVQEAWTVLFRQYQSSSGVTDFHFPLSAFMVSAR